MSHAERALHHTVHGAAGPPVLLLHGLGSCGADWTPQVDALAPHYRVVAVDLPGHGASPLPSGRLTIEDMAGAVAALAARHRADAEAGRARRAPPVPVARAARTLRRRRQQPGRHVATGVRRRHARAR